MVTAEEIGGLALFSGLDGDGLERLARVAREISLTLGEYAVREGDDRALFAVLGGRVEAVKAFDGVERVVGERGVGDVFGEVPTVLGTVFPVGFRAAERSRVMKIEPGDYHAVASTVPDVAKQVGKLASEGIGGARGLQGIAADPPPPRAVLVGDRLDPACMRLRRFLDGNRITFKWLTPEMPGAEQEWGGPLPAPGDCPTIRVIDGKTVVRPQLYRVAELLGLDRQPEAAEYDTVIVGGGPAGLAAAVYGSSGGLSTIALEREAPGGQAGTSSRIEDYLGFPSGVSGAELASRALQQARRLGAEILVTRVITRIDAPDRLVHLDGGDVLRAKTIILACGVYWRHPAIEGLEQLVGKGVFYGAARSQAADALGQDVHIVGAGNSAGEAAIFFSRYARSVTILCRGESLKRSMSRYLVDQLAMRSNIHAICAAEVTAVHGGASLEAIEVRDRTRPATTRLESGGLFLFIGADAETGWLPPEIALDARGYVLTGSDVSAAGRWSLERDPYLLETSVPGIFACGDVRSGPVKRVAAALGEGSMAIAFVHQYLKGAQARLGG